MPTFCPPSCWHYRGLKNALSSLASPTEECSCLQTDWLLFISGFVVFHPFIFFLFLLFSLSMNYKIGPRCLMRTLSIWWGLLLFLMVGGFLNPIVSNNYYCHYCYCYCFDGGRIYPIVSNYLGLRTIKGDIRREAGGGPSPDLLKEKNFWLLGQSIKKDEIFWPQGNDRLAQSMNDIPTHTLGMFMSQ